MPLLSSTSYFDATDSDVVVSPTGIIHVLGYTPSEGEGGAPISVRIHYLPDVTEEIFVRLVIGDSPVPTTVREIGDTAYGRWQLDAVAPPFDHSSTASTKVLISVQALNKESTVLDSATFGEFSYWAPGTSLHSDLSTSHKKPKLCVSTDAHLSLSLPQKSSVRRRRPSYLSTPSPISPIHDHILSTTKHELQLHRRTKMDIATKPKNNRNRDLHLQTPILDLVTPLQGICLDWSPTEYEVGRRLVRFNKVQDGRRLVVSCEPIMVENLSELDSVISCIYRDETSSFHVTSVDIIFLLERLTNNDFPVEEKNRIRRNLEGLHPTTVSKHKPGFEDFFQRIMDFPDPKPRNIEKDLKVFDWFSLDQALEKILSKYTIDISAPLSGETESSSTEQSPSNGSEEPEYVPCIKLEDTYIDDSPLPTSLRDELAYLASSEGSESLCSPLDISASANAYQSYSPEMGSHGANSQWNDFKTTLDTATLDPYATYEVTRQGTPMINYSEVDFAAHYDALAYQSCIPEEPWN